MQKLINEVSQKINALETAQALYSRQLSPDFNTFDYINTDELGLSRILAALLNPQGSHAQQGVFLKLFVEHCLPTVYKADKWQAFLNNIEETKVLLEVVTSKSNSLRRMDIYLQCQVGDKSYGICIENKPYASDQFEQLKDYATELEKRHSKAWHLVYLNESDDGPSKRSVNEKTLNSWMVENRYSHLRFSDLTDWLKACKVECQNHSVSEFISQLIKFIQKQFMGIEDMSESNAVLEIITQSPETIDASIKVSNTIDQMKKDLIKKLKKDLIVKSEQLDYRFNIQNMNVDNAYEKIIFGSVKDIGTICLEFRKQYSHPYIGFRFISSEVRDSNLAVNHRKDFDRILSENNRSETFSKTNWWIAYYKFRPYNWRIYSKPWQMIHTGEMAEKILKEVDVIRTALIENGYSIE